MQTMPYSRRCESSIAQQIWLHVGRGGVTMQDPAYTHNLNWVYMPDITIVTYLKFNDCEIRRVDTI